MDNLLKAREFLENDLNELVDEKKHLQNKLRRASPADKETLRAEKSEITSRIVEIRKHLKINCDIENRAHKIQNTLDLIVENEAR